MARRVNTPFVIVLIVVVMALGLVGGYVLFPSAYSWLLGKGDVSEYVERARALLNQGQAPAALTEINKAMQIRPNDVQLLLLYCDALAKMPSKSDMDAQRLSDDLKQKLDYVVRLNPTNPEPLERLMKLYLRCASEQGMRQDWDKMYNRSVAVLAVDPKSVLARRYRGISGVIRMATINVDPDERQRFKEDLEAAIAANPHDRDASHYLARWHLVEASTVQKEPGQGKLANHLREQAVEKAVASAKLKDKDGDNTQDAEWLLNSAEVMLAVSNSLKSEEDEKTAESNKKQAEAGGIVVPEADAKALDAPSQKLRKQAYDLIEESEKLLQRNPNPPSLVIRAASMLPSVDAKRVKVEYKGRSLETLNGLVRAEELGRASAKINQTNIALQFFLAYILKEQRKFEDAVEAFAKAETLPVPLSPVDALEVYRYQLASRYFYADTLLTTAAFTTDRVRRKELLDAADDKIKQYEDNNGKESPNSLRLRGKYALVANDPWRAAKLLDQAIAQITSKNELIDTLELCAKALVLVRQYGAAVDRLQRIVTLNPNYIAPRLDMARIQLEQQQLSAAYQNLMFVIEKDPTLVEAKRMLTMLYDALEEYEKAIELNKKLDPEEKDLNTQITIAILHAKAGRAMESRTKLEVLFEQNPGNIRILAMLVSLDATKEHCERYLQMAETKGNVNPELIKVFRKNIKGERNVLENWVKITEDNQSDPLTKHIKLYMLYRGAGKVQEALDELNEAAKIDPDNPQVIEARFTEAREARNWDEATKLARRAADKNLDAADGKFYEGKLALSQGNLKEAITAFSAGLKILPFFSDGWKLLADTQRMDNDLTEALNSYRLALEKNPTNVSVLLARGDLYDQMRQYPDALADYRMAYEFAKRNRPIMDRYFLYEERHGSKEKVLKERERIAREAPGDILNRRGLILILAKMKQTERAQTMLNNFILEEGMTTPNALISAQIRKERGEFDEAIKILEKNIYDKGPNVTAEDYQAKAKFLVAADRLDEAVIAYQPAIKLEDQEFRPITRELADMLFLRERYAAAAAQYKLVWESTARDRATGERYAESLVRGNMIAEGEAVLVEVAKLYGETSNLWMLRGLVAGAKKDIPGALKAFDEAVKIDPNRSMVYYSRGQFLVRTVGDLKRAKDDVRKAIQLDTNNLPARMLLANIYYSSRELGEAARELQMAIDVNEEFAPARLTLAGVYLEMKDYKQLKALLEEGAEKFPKESAWMRYRGLVLLTEGKNDDAIAQLRLAYETPNYENTFELAGAYIASRQPQQAVELLESEASKNFLAKYARMQVVLGRAYYALGELATDAEAKKANKEKASAHFTQAVKLAEGSIVDLFYVCDQVVSGAGLEKASAFFDTLSPGTKTWAVIQVRLAMTENLSHQPDAALQRLERLKDPFAADSLEAQLLEGNRAAGYTLAKQYKKALDSYEKLLKIDPNDPRSLNNSAFILARYEGRTVEALDRARLADKIRPGDPEILDTLGYCYYAAKKVKEAETPLRTSVAKREMPTNLLHLALVLYDYRTASYNAEADRYLQQAYVLAEREQDKEILVEVRALMEVHKLKP